MFPAPLKFPCFQYAIRAVILYIGTLFSLFARLLALAAATHRHYTKSTELHVVLMCFPFSSNLKLRWKKRRPCKLLDTSCKLLDTSCKLLDTSCKLLDTSCKLLDTSCKLLDTSCKLLDTSCKLLDTSCKLLDTSCKLLDTSCKLLDTSCKLLDTSCKLLDTSCKLLDTSCKLLDTSCKLLDTSCKLLLCRMFWSAFLKKCFYWRVVTTKWRRATAKAPNFMKAYKIIK